MNAPLSSILNLGELKAALLFANTPVYLYTRFRKDYSVQLLAQQSETELLLADLDEILHIPAQSADDVVMIFALCIALSFKPFSELARLKDFSSESLEWFGAIIALVMEDAPKAQYIDVKLSRRPSVTIQDQPSPESTQIASNSVNVLIRRT
jgi:hypothetical protein